MEAEVVQVGPSVDPSLVQIVKKYPDGVIHGVVPGQQKPQDNMFNYSHTGATATAR